MSRQVVSCLVGLMLTGSPAMAAAPPAAVSRATLDRLLVEYRAAGLPALPKESRLVRYPRSCIIEQGWSSTLYTLGFWINPKEKERTIRSGLRGTVGGDGSSRVKLADAIQHPDLPRADVVFAVQCYSLGWTDLARETLRCGADRDEATCLARLRKDAWKYWKWQIDKRGSDWRIVSQQMKRLIAVEQSLDTPENRELVADLDLAATPRNAQPGSIESLIDELINVDSSWFRHSVPFDLGEPRHRVARLGFAAVPALIEALEDKRITRAVAGGHWKMPVRRLRIQDLASELLVEISGRYREDGLRLTVASPLTQAEALQWWMTARAIGEEKYAAARVFSEEGSYPDLHQLATLADRYPRQLPGVYRRLLKDPREFHNSWAFAEAVAASQLPLQEKRELLRAGAAHENFTYRLDALRHLRFLDSVATRKALADTFLNLPGKRVKDSLLNLEVQLASFVAALDDDLVWRAFEQAVRRADPELQRAMLSALDRMDKESKLEADIGKLTPQRRRALTIQAALGEGLRDDDHYPSIRDKAILEMAYWLDLTVPEEVDSSPERRAAFFASVRKAWERERNSEIQRNQK
jgi:hypothetical protein